MVKVKFVTMVLLLTERGNDNKRGHFGAHTFVRKNETFSPKSLLVVRGTKRHRPLH
jgi:hypothetical protein